MRNVKSFDAFYEAMFPFAYKFAYAYLFDKSVIEDVLQETFLAAYRCYATQLRDHPNPKGWIVTTIKHKASKMAKKEFPLMGNVEFYDDYGLLEVLPPDFPEEDRQLLAAYYEQRHSIASLAFMYQQTPNHVRVRLFRARAKLRAMLQNGANNQQKAGDICGR